MVYRSLILHLAVLISFSARTQTYETTPILKKENRFIGDVEGVVPLDADPVGLISSFNLHIQWWSLMGEPVEYYDFTWKSTSQLTLSIDGEERLITRAMLSKYPDLLKRFDLLSPRDVQIKIEGNAGSGIISDDRFGYEIPSINIVPSYANEKGKGIVPGSQHWNEFFTWSALEYTYKKNDRNDRSLLNSNKEKFETIQKLNVTALLKKIEWPEHDLKHIVAKYDRYENGTESPKNTEAEDLNDMLSDISDTEITAFEIEFRNGKEGVMAKDGRILIPFKEWDIKSFDPKTGFAQIEKSLGVREKSGSCDQVFKAEIIELSTVDSSGEPVIESEKFAVPHYESINLNISLSVVDPNETAEERAARKRKAEENRRKKAAERERCNALNAPIFEAFKREMQADNIDTSRL
ncbi:hypothetical protein [Roseivirga pacifica]|uniref:hypothetical protein n=1 Tax=Roseivirga pacifica TaxID=1267423 RepID=UPI00227B21D0|nr:hypothetical protein [Roseivirga pacifica]